MSAEASPARRASARATALLCLAASLTSTTWGARAQAQDASAASLPPREGVYLSWVRLQGAEECPDVLRIAEDVSRRLGWNPFQGKPLQYIEAEIRRDDSGWWRVEIYLRDTDSRARGSRTVVSRAASCDTLASVAGLAIAIIIDPDVLTRPAAAPEVLHRDGPVQPIVIREPGIGRLSVLGVTAAGLLPGLALGIGLAGQVGLSRNLSLSLASVLLPEVRQSVSAGEFGYGMSYGQLGVCADAAARPGWGLAACGALLAGAVHSVVYSPLPSHPGQRFYLGASAALRLTVALGVHWEVGAAIEVITPLVRQRFLVELPAGETTAYSQPALASAAQLALVYRFR